MEDDRRLTGQEQYLQGASVAWKCYYRRSPTWDYDHCAFWWAKFMERGPDSPTDALHDGYAATTQDRPDYEWICEPCFEGFKDRFEWRVVAAKPHTGPDLA